MLGKQKGLITVKWPEQCLAYSEPSINVDKIKYMFQRQFFLINPDMDVSIYFPRTGRKNLKVKTAKVNITIFKM